MNNPNIAKFYIVVIIFCEALTSAIYINSGDLLKNSIWALPIISVQAVMGLMLIKEAYPK